VLKGDVKLQLTSAIANDDFLFKFNLIFWQAVCLCRISGIGHHETNDLADESHDS